MTALPDADVDLVPSDPDLLVELSRVAWAAGGSCVPLCEMLWTDTEGRPRTLSSG